uniref:Peptidase S1 domain-containing protein n=1 Tax=Anopheles farauti TaxID=69004 RepID=A0A182Q6I6_9DIPT
MWLYGQICYTSTGATGVCSSLTACPVAFQLNINPFSLFGGSSRGCQNFFGFGSVCCSTGFTNPVVPTTTVPPRQYPDATIPTTVRPPVGLECINPDGSFGPCVAGTVKPPTALPVTSTTKRSMSIRTTTPITLQQRLADEPEFVQPVVVPTPEQGCGVSNVEHNRIVGGVPAALNGWPWMALVGYEEAFGDVDFRCGGSLITDRHVLTAAHCILSSLSVVRLGEHDLRNTTESPHVDVPVYKYISHPDYDTYDGHSDLAILFLTRTVQFTDKIKPICLPTSDPVRSADFTGYNPFIAGWGRTKETGFEAPVLQELQIPILENEECSQLYKKIRKLFSKKQFNEAVLCAGFLAGGKDSCQGDSGGPLMLPYLIKKQFYYFQIGVVSYGVGCARAELPDPTIETYVAQSVCGYNEVTPMVCCPTLRFAQQSPNFTTTPTTPPTTTAVSGLFFFASASGGAFNPAPTATTASTPSSTVRLPTNDADRCGMSNGTHTRVVGGVDAQLNAWPWMAALGYRSSSFELNAGSQFLCGGTLITTMHVLTVAHCIQTGFYFVRLGEYDIASDQDGATPVDVYVQRWYVHERYDEKTIHNDIALVLLQKSIAISESIRPICLPLEAKQRTKDLTYYAPFIAGWGAVAFNGPLATKLQEAQVVVLPVDQCAFNYKLYFPGQIFDDTVLCAGFPQGGKDSCQGDSGGPLMLPELASNGQYYYYTLIGLVSYGYECARAGFPGVYVKVTSYLHWIEANLNF